MTAVFARDDATTRLDRLADPHLLRELAYVGGRWVAAATGRTVLEVTDPASARRSPGSLRSMPIRLTEAISAAAAFSAWRDRCCRSSARRSCANGIGLILEAREDLALLMTLEQGKPLAESRGEIDYAASFIEWYAEEGKRLNAESVTSHLPGAEMIVRREAARRRRHRDAVELPLRHAHPQGRRRARRRLHHRRPPLLETPLSALALAELGERAGLPAGVFNVVTGDAATIVGRMNALIRPRAALSFTGSTEIGRLIAGQCAPTMKRLVMELGGHAPLIVFDDADIVQGG
jgi:aspartate-semialdehyde dehydrogenase